MNKDLGKLFKQDNKRIDDSLQSKLSHKINNSIKNKFLIKSIILVTVAIIGAGVFSWSLSSVFL